MKKVYGINNAKFRQLALGVQYQALDTGKVDTANIFTTDAQLASGKYTVLKDPKGVFGFQNVSFVIDKDKLAALGGDQFMAVINSVNKLLTTDAITADEQGGRHRQAGRGDGGQAVPDGEQARLTAVRRRRGPVSRLPLRSTRAPRAPARRSRAAWPAGRRRRSP